MNANDSGVELYNIAEDPREQRDQAREQLVVARQLSAKLANWIDGLPAPGPAVAR